MPNLFVFSVLAFCFGLVIGSFLNVVIHRGPVIWNLVDAHDEDTGLSLAAPRSRCPQCRTQIKAVHLVPLIGFLLLRGKCAACAAPISWRYPAVELLTGLLAATAVLLAGPSWTALAFFVFSCFLIPLAFIDLETTFLPDALTLPLILTGLAVSLTGPFVGLTDALIGAVVGYLVFWLIGEAFYRLRGKDGLGQGDAKLLAGIGAWTGWMALPFVVLLSSILGLAALLVMHMSGRELNRDTAIPFGPFLAFSGILVLLFYLSGLPLSF